jgi:hypothetical protein
MTIIGETIAQRYQLMEDSRFLEMMVLRDAIMYNNYYHSMSLKIRVQ